MYGMPGVQGMLKMMFWEILRPKTVLSKLIFANIVVYFAMLLLKLLLNVLGFLFQSADLQQTIYGGLVELLACPASFEDLIFCPWTLLTSCFVHLSFWHLFFNMMVLHFAGKVFRTEFSEKQLLSLYLLGGIVGNLCYVAAYNFFPAFEIDKYYSMAVGASGSIMSILFAATMRLPKFEVSLFLFGPIKLMWLAVILIAVDVLSIPHGNAGGHIAHIGGALAGIAFPFILQRNFDFSMPTRKKTKRKKYATSSDYEAYNRPLSDDEYNARRKANEDKIDAILDKISQNGYESLSKEEKDFLFHHKR